MRQVALPEIGTYQAWRDEARALLAARVPPEEVLWHRGTAEADLFAEALPPPAAGAPVTVPKSFVSLARLAVWHRDPQRFARLYALLWALRSQPRLMEDRGDARVAKLNHLAKEVGRDRHKMHAFVRFRDIGEPGAHRRRFAAWFEPTHFTLEPAAPFFAKRFGDMDWSIFTPDLAAHFTDGALSFAPPGPRPDLPEDAAEDLWRTYFRNIFNPARLKTQAMQSEMPKKYWKNMPEAALIPEMIASARSRAAEMADAAPTLPPVRAQRIAAQRPHPGPAAPEDMKTALGACRRCPLWKDATQAVPGEGPRDAALMIVGEQPGDTEDLTGRPFTGPAGQLLDQLAATAGLDRNAAYVTNAVKHFKFTPRGKRRLHQRPDRTEVDHCRWWLEAERAEVQPALILALGATAALSLTGDGRDVTKRRGRVERTPDGTPVLIALHPSYILRAAPADQPKAEAQLTADLALAARLIADPSLLLGTNTPRAERA